MDLIETSLRIKNVYETTDNAIQGAVQKVTKRALRLRSATVLSPFSKGKIVLPALLGQPLRNAQKPF